MYDKHLDTFLTAADAGSFSKAGELLYISANAVIKQINILEHDLGLTLFNRTNRGIELTESGQSIYRDAKRLIRFANKAIETARKMPAEDNLTVRIGTSLMRPCRSFVDYWISVCKGYSDIRLQIVPFDDSLDAWEQLLADLGNKLDVVAGIYPSTLWGNRCQVLKLDDLPLYCAVSRKNTLSNRSKINLSDLHNQTLFMVERGDTSFIDAVRNELEDNHPEIHIQDVSSYDTKVFNQCDQSGGLMITIKEWSEIHPSLVTIPVDWEFTVPYGLIYSLHPSKTVIQFVEAVKKACY